MRILMLTQWFDPEPTFKGLLFARELKRRGHDVTVLTGFPNYPGGELYSGYQIRPLKNEVVDGIKVIRVALYPSHNSSPLHRIGNYLSFALTASVASLFVRRPDVVYVYHPPGTMGLPASILKTFRGVPVVYDIQDLWPDTLAATGMLSNRRVLGLIDKGMGRIYRMSTRIVVLSPGFKAALVERGVPERKVSVIPNWADEEQINTQNPGSDRSRVLGFEGRVTVTFAGNLGMAQSLGTILDAAAMLQDLPNVRFLLIGTGTEATRLAEESSARELENVDFMPRRPVNEIGEILALSDALLVHLKDDPLFAITIPSKTQAYLLAGRPILMGVRGDSARIVEESGAGIVFAPDDSSCLAAAVRALVAMSVADREELGKAGRTYYDHALSLDVGTDRFLQVFEEAGGLRPRMLATKRMVDVVGSGLGLVLASIPMIGLALAIRSRLGSPVIFRQVRPGLNGEPFEMLKFRTMTDQLDASGDLLPDSERLTKFGRALRASSLDELPELFNVMRGEMSLVGPRPLLMRYTPFFTEQESRRFAVRPGITGWAQVNGRNKSPWDERLANDTWYVGNISLRLDLKIIGLTVARMLRRRDVVTDPESVMRNLDDERRTVSHE